MTNGKSEHEIKQAGPVSSPFDQIRRVRLDGSEYWSARELMPHLGYAKWERMEDAIDRAQNSCRAQGLDPADHFPGAGKMVQFGQGGPPGQDYELTRYGCYLVAMNGDPRKPEIAAAQNYFLVKTRQAELHDQAAQAVPGQDPLVALAQSAAASAQLAIELRQSQLAFEARLDAMQRQVGDLVELRSAALGVLSELPRSHRRAKQLSTRAKVNMLIRQWANAHGLVMIENGEASDSHDVHTMVWRRMYLEFKYRYHFDARARSARSGASKLDEIEKAGKMEDFFDMVSELLS